MQHYLNTDGDSGVDAYEYGSDYIRVRFLKTFKVYRYTYKSAGKDNIEYMKQFADSGNGLNEFINRHVRNLYEEIEE